jgi:hypothetical protein
VVTRWLKYAREGTKEARGRLKVSEVLSGVSEMAEMCLKYLTCAQVG